MSNTIASDFTPDCGIHLKSLGFKSGFKILLPSINSDHLIKVSRNTYTTSTIFTFKGKELCMSIDFDKRKLNNLYKSIPKSLSDNIKNTLSIQNFFQAENELLSFGALLELGRDKFHNVNESYIPFMVKRIL